MTLAVAKVLGGQYECTTINYTDQKQPSVVLHKEQQLTMTINYTLREN